jgi:hypothetical protein
MARSRLAGAMLAAWMFVCAPALAGEPQPAPKVEVDVAGQLSIDENGAVSGVELTSQVPDAIASIVKQAVQGWTFEPIVHDGKPVPAKSNMQLFLIGVPQDGGFRLRVERAQFGFPRKPRDTGHRMNGNFFPKEAMRAGVLAEVMLAVRVDAAGNVLDVSPLRSRLVRGMKTASKLATKWRTDFEKSAVAVMRQQKYEPADPRLPGDGTTAFVTNVCYAMGDVTPVASIWTQDDTAVTSTGIPTWLSGGKLAEGAIDRVAEGQVIAFGGGPVLRSQVVGTLL